MDRVNDLLKDFQDMAIRTAAMAVLDHASSNSQNAPAQSASRLLELADAEAYAGD
ncbi:hypothetical protein [Indioceanicola profundi]|uniref:hypothetical protein n=1 Tax=Indioceanicola profundi TaxID=2220096 RepID=UPI0013C53271|nr:hypothetical protein [Indioceanicola profundi]